MTVRWEVRELLRGSYEIMNGRHLAERLGAGEYSMDVPVCDANGHCETASQIIDLEKSVWGGGRLAPSLPQMLIEWQNQVWGRYHCSQNTLWAIYPPCSSPFL